MLARLLYSWVLVAAGDEVLEERGIQNSFIDGMSPAIYHACGQLEVVLHGLGLWEETRRMGLEADTHGSFGRHMLPGDSV